MCSTKLLDADGSQAWSWDWQTFAKPTARVIPSATRIQIQQVPCSSFMFYRVCQWILNLLAWMCEHILHAYQHTNTYHYITHSTWLYINCLHDFPWLCTTVLQGLWITWHGHMVKAGWAVNLIFAGKKMEDLCPTSHNLDVPFAGNHSWLHQPGDEDESMSTESIRLSLQYNYVYILSSIFHLYRYKYTYILYMQI